jgi:hypothetical protein
LTDGKIRFALPDGKTVTHEIKRGNVGFAEAELHAPENVGETTFELIAIELKAARMSGTEGLPNNEMQRTKPAQATELRR